MVLKLAVVWTAKRKFYSQKVNKIRQEEVKKGRRQKKTPHQSRKLGWLLILVISQDKQRFDINQDLEGTAIMARA